LVLLKRNDDNNGHRGSDGNVSTALNCKGTDVYDIAIRPLTRSDVWDLRHYCFPEETAESVADYVDRALGFVEKGSAAHFVAESRGHAVANAQMICWRGRAEIGSLVVAEPLRGLGIGSALIEALSEAAADLGAEQIEIGADKRDERVLGLYQRLGFNPFKEVHLSRGGAEEEHVVYLEKPVPPRA
jgi:ribosomal protein S18 acetylase RimI-like enzyme